MTAADGLVLSSTAWPPPEDGVEIGTDSPGLGLGFEVLAGIACGGGASVVVVACTVVEVVEVVDPRIVVLVVEVEVVVDVDVDVVAY
jgi:hypothetical protein